MLTAVGSSPEEGVDNKHIIQNDLPPSKNWNSIEIGNVISL